VKIIQFLNKYLLVGLPESYSSDTLRKLKVLNGLRIVGLLVMLAFSIIWYLQGQYVLFCIDFLGFLAYLADFLYLKKSRNIHIAGITNTTLTGLLIFAVMASGTANNSGFFWCYVFPLVAFFLLGKKAGLMAVFCFLALAVLSIFLLPATIGIAALPYEFKIRFFGSFIAVSGLAMVYEHFRHSTHEQLKQMAIEAQKADKAKTEFLANMSHEFRTPMNGIIGMTELLSRTELVPAQKEFAETIRNSANGLMAMISDLLDFTGLESENITLDIIPFDLHSLINEIIESKTHAANIKGLKLGSQVDEEIIAPLYCDSQKLDHILRNLIDNAIKFTSAGEVKITVRKIQEVGDGILLYFSVEDTGIGIPESKQAQLFDSFTQADGSSTRRYGGIGLGLTIAAQLVKLMGGDIALSSTEGKGSTFCFTLHLKNCE